MLFNLVRGFGFLRSRGRRSDLFVHMSKLPLPNVMVGRQRALFEVGATRKKLSAANVEPGRLPVSPQCFFHRQGTAVLILLLQFMRA